MNQAVERCASEYFLFLNSNVLVADADRQLNVKKITEPNKFDFVLGETVFLDEESNRGHLRRQTKTLQRKVQFRESYQVLCDSGRSARMSPSALLPRATTIGRPRRLTRSLSSKPRKRIPQTLSSVARSVMHNRP